MPQLNTSTWLTTMMSTLTALFILVQLKIHSHTFPINPTHKPMTMMKSKTPWELKWTKIYSPPSLPQQ